MKNLALRFAYQSVGSDGITGSGIKLLSGTEELIGVEGLPPLLCEQLFFAITQINTAITIVISDINIISTILFLSIPFFLFIITF